MSALFERRRFRLVAWALVLVRLWLAQCLRVLAVGYAFIDDRLFVELARNIARGDWLGRYDYLTLAKGPAYPLFVAASFLAGLPLTIAQQLAYAGACWLVVRALTPAIRSEGARLILLGLLLWNPMSYEVLVLGRVLRQNIGVPLAMAAFAGVAGLALRGDKPWRVQVAWAATAGLSFGLFWMTREEGLWIAPALAVAVLGVGLWGGPPGALLRRAGGALVAAAAAAAVIGGVCEMNLRHYGWFGAVEFRAPEFVSAYAALQRVYPRGTIPMVPVTREARERIYAVSPTFASLRGWIEGPAGEGMAEGCSALTGRPAAEREIAGGWFVWLFREAVERSGQGSDAAEALATYGKIDREVNAACDDGRLPSGGRRRTLMPHLTGAMWRRLPGTYATFVDTFVSFRGFNVGPGESKGSDAELALFSEMTRDRLYPRPGEARPPADLAGRLDEAKREALYWIGKTMRWVLWIAGWAAVLAWAAQGVLLSRRGRWPGGTWLLAGGLLVSCAALLALDALVEVSSFPLIGPGAFAEAYPLWIAFIVLGGAAAVEGWKGRETAAAMERTGD